MTQFSMNGNGQHGDDQPLRAMLREHINEQRDFNKKIERIHTVVFGDKEAEIKGLVAKVDDHGKYISLDKKMKIFGTGLAASGATGWALFDTIKHFFGIK